MGKDREAGSTCSYFSRQYDGLRRFLEKEGHIHSRTDSSVTILSLNPTFYRVRFSQVGEIVAVRKIETYTDGNGYTVEADETVLLSPIGAFRLIREPLRRSDGKVLPPQGRQDIDLTLRSQKRLRQAVENNIFNLDGVSTMPLTELQPATTF